MLLGGFEPMISVSLQLYFSPQTTRPSSSLHLIICCVFKDTQEENKGW